MYIGVQGGLAWTHDGNAPENFMNKYYELNNAKSKTINNGKYGGANTKYSYNNISNEYTLKAGVPSANFVAVGLTYKFYYLYLGTQ